MATAEVLELVSEVDVLAKDEELVETVQGSMIHSATNGLSPDA